MVPPSHTEASPQASEPPPVEVPEADPAGTPALNRKRVENLLAEAYSSLFRMIRNRGRERAHERTFRQELFEICDARVAAMAAADQAYFVKLERSHQERARRIHEKVAARLKFWDLPALPAPETYLWPVEISE